LLEEGVVVQIIDGKTASVELERKSACAKCLACSTGPGSRMRIEACNPPGAVPGDRVRLKIEARGVVLGMTLLYLLPALGLIFGIVVIKGSASVLLGVILMFLFFQVARYYGRKRASYTAEIKEIIQ